MRDLRTEKEITQNWQDGALGPLVSICCATFNHERYIEDALEGFLIQETRFPIEILIHDDASTDRTADIVREYAATYPSLIKPIYQKENHYSRGILPDQEFNFPRATGKYIAMCEGDDYWTDPLKLYKQVKLLESNPDFSMSFHPVLNFYDDGRAEPNIFPVLRRPKSVYTIYDLFPFNFMNTCSVMYRRIYARLPDWSTRHVVGDYILHLLHAHYGEIAFHGDVMARYRMHGGGVWSCNGTHLKQRNLLDWLNILDDFNLYSDRIYDNEIRRGKAQLIPGLAVTYLESSEYSKALACIQQYFDKRYLLSRPEQFHLLILLVISKCSIPSKFVRYPYKHARQFLSTLRQCVFGK